MDSPADLAKNLLRPKLQEPEPELDRLAHVVIGAAIEMHRQLGPGFLEAIYEEAMCVELALRKVAFLRQPEVAISYKGIQVGQSR